MTISYPPNREVTFASVGSFLCSWYDREYVSIGFTFGHVTTDVGGESGELPAPPVE